MEACFVRECFQVGKNVPFQITTREVRAAETKLPVPNKYLSRCDNRLPEGHQRKGRLQLHARISLTQVLHGDNNDNGINQ